MASVKNLKSKGRAVMTAFDYPFDAFLLRDPLYQYRKEVFADTPPAKIVRPLRVVRRRFEQALRLWDRGIVTGTATVPYPHGEEQLYLAAERAAKRGDGALVRLAAA